MSPEFRTRVWKQCLLLNVAFFGIIDSGKCLQTEFLECDVLDNVVKKIEPILF